MGETARSLEGEKKKRKKKDVVQNIRYPLSKVVPVNQHSPNGAGGDQEVSISVLKNDVVSTAPNHPPDAARIC